MLRTSLICITLIGLTLGCQSQKPDAAAGSPSLTEVTPPPTPTPTPSSSYTPGPVAPTEVAMTSTPTDIGSGPAAGRKYTVKRGDTLWSIAKTSYGDGKQYTKIVSANPGVSPQSLKIGQQLNIP